jgi:hypothetical protein
MKGLEKLIMALPEKNYKLQRFLPSEKEPPVFIGSEVRNV